MMRRRLTSISAVLLLGFLLSMANIASAQTADDDRVEEVELRNGETTLEGRLFLPGGLGPFPAVVLIHSAGPRNWEEYAQHAKLFTAAGIAALAYDKRIEGYSATGIGEKSRSYIACCGTRDDLGFIGLLFGSGDHSPHSFASTFRR